MPSLAESIPELLERLQIRAQVTKHMPATMEIRHLGDKKT
jgi:hypothetical protein